MDVLNIDLTFESPFEQLIVKKMVKEATSSVVGAIMKSRLDKNIRAIILGGSFSRGEETVLWSEYKIKFLSDLDLHFILKYPWDFFWLKRRIKIALENLALPIEVTVGLEWRMNRNRTIQFYELKKNGKVLFGDQYILDLISIESPNQIPKWEGIRLLFNRLIELTNVFIKYNTKFDANEDLDTECHYICMKAYLACSDAILLLENEFAPSCRERYEQFNNLFKISQIKQLLPDLYTNVTEAFKFKLNLRGSSLIPRSQIPQLWFDCRDTILTTLNYSLSLYMGIEGKKMADLLSELEKRMPCGNHFFLNFMESLIRDKKIPFPIVFKPPRLYAQIASVYHAQALNEDRTVNPDQMKLALNYLKLCIKSNDSPVLTEMSFVAWKKLGNAIFIFSKKTPDIRLNKDF